VAAKEEDVAAAAGKGCGAFEEEVEEKVAGNSYQPCLVLLRHIRHHGHLLLLLVLGDDQLRNAAGAPLALPQIGPGIRCSPLHSM